jgi:nicotinate-nucleotide adenylyltransferase
MQKIGLFGGSFDPVHLGHLLVAQAACEEFGLERLIFIPAAQSPFKPDTTTAPAPLRIQMLRLALAGETRFEIDDQEIARGGTSYTIETVHSWQKRCPESQLFWLIGADHVPTLNKWRNAADLAAALDFLIIPRPGQPDQQAPEPFRTHRLKGFPLGVSSSQIRQRVQAGLPIRHLAGPRVAEAIWNNALYL